MKTLDEVIKAKELCELNCSDKEHCQDCPYAKQDANSDWSFFCHDCELDTLYYMREYQKLKIELERKWIPVTKALPRNETNVLVTVRDDSGDTPWEYTSTGWRTPDGKYWVIDYEICYGVIAWMPLPEPLRGK